MHAKSLQLCLTLSDPMDCSLPGSSVHGFSRQEYWSGLPYPPPGDLSNPGIEPKSLMPPVLVGMFFTISVTWEAPNIPKWRGNYLLLMKKPDMIEEPSLESLILQLVHSAVTTEYCKLGGL